jgi:hypothetical protein
MDANHASDRIPLPAPSASWFFFPSSLPVSSTFLFPFLFLFPAAPSLFLFLFPFAEQLFCVAYFFLFT